jgi:FkbM family methyltransferase
MKIIVEVGANQGKDTQRWLKDGNNIVYAFEPTPELILHLKEKFKDNDRFNLIPAAVDIENSWKWFNIAGNRDWGCSSLHEFNPNIEELWTDRPDFKVTDRCKVMTMRLDTFIENYKIEKIDYLWVDAQGNDFLALQSLGKYISIVNEGKCEAAFTVDLYSNTDNNVDTIRLWLEERGFECRVSPDKQKKEADIHFKRK